MDTSHTYRLLPPQPAAGHANDTEILTPDALDFVATLARHFSPRVLHCLQARQERQQRLNAGEQLDFLPDTIDIRNGDWRVAPLPDDLQDRRVELTGPPERKRVINALNSGAQCFMADFEDATVPTWDNLVQGQRNLRDAVTGDIEYTDPRTHKHYALADNTAVLLVRPRGWHLYEAHMEVDNRAVPAALFDFGLYFFHNATRLIHNGTGPYFYLPKLEHHQEAALWNDVFNFAQDRLDIPRGTIKATVLIETLPAAFQMHEILHALREHAAGLNCGRWDYIFSYIKSMHARSDAILPDRAEIGMTQPFMRAYTQLVIQTCHRRGALAMGGMAANIPIRDDDKANLRALESVRKDKTREVQDGHDGSWVAHPALVPVAREVFDRYMPSANQLSRLREDITARAVDLLAVPQGHRTDASLRYNIRVAILYIEAWLGGTGAVPIYHLMEDAATAEISRAQIWQWLHHRVEVGEKLLDEPRLQRTIEEEMQVLRDETGPDRFDAGHFHTACRVFTELCLDKHFTDFLTLPAYEHILQAGK